MRPSPSSADAGPGPEPEPFFQCCWIWVLPESPQGPAVLMYSHSLRDVAASVTSPPGSRTLTLTLLSHAALSHSCLRHTLVESRSSA